VGHGLEDGTGIEIRQRSIEISLRKFRIKLSCVTVVGDGALEIILGEIREAAV
jgi:hypothetical protein